MVSHGKRLAKINKMQRPVGAGEEHGREARYARDWKDAVVASVASDDQALRQHILDMGLTPGTEVTMMKYAPMGDPLEIRLRGYELTLRKDDAASHRARGYSRHRYGSALTPQSARRSIRPWARGRIRPVRQRRPCPRARRCTLLSPATKTAVRPRCSTSLQAPNQHVGNFPWRDGRPQGRHYP